MDMAFTISLLIIAAIFLSSSLFYFAHLLLYKPHNINPNDVELALAPPTTTDYDTVRKFKTSELQAFASNFTSSPVIGVGGFSTVYLASLDSTPASPRVAVKVHNSSQRLHLAFRQELDILLCIKHPYIVRLVGYCDDKDEGILVFEYVSNGTLYDVLHATSDLYFVLSWSYRVSILFRIATALKYLHEREVQIIHGDIKSSNILLDENFDPKLCDFGSARMGFKATVTRSADQMMGSLGYVDPHYLRTGLVSKKSDVYSFGVLILEIITGMEAFDSEKERLLTSVVGSIRLEELIDHKLGNAYDAKEFLVMTELAAQCIDEQPVLRPSMEDVVNIMREKVCIIPDEGKLEM